MSSAIYRLTTPTLEYLMPDDVPVDELKWLVWTFTQGNAIVLEKSLTDLELDGQLLCLSLTQAETKLFSAEAPIKFQIRCGIDDDALASVKGVIDVYDVYNDNVIEVITV